MARRPNYGFEKRQKEMERQKKKDAKAERKELRKQEAEVGADGAAAHGDDVEGTEVGSDPDERGAA